ncbi:MAG: mutL [Bacillales bacterium]|jgi:DNA mismatch repair protein MutL|nr:mutL [Bacillales bacterium]
MNDFNRKGGIVLGKIVQLSDNLSNKIAAGEVVERPASVVKELVENSIDAGSTVIEVFIEQAGLKSIRILDNGEGIAPDDALNAFERHATSKIKDENDLFHIRTLGFRGEALPSIASVSHVELRTSTGEGMGTFLVIEGGKILQHIGSDSRKGTDFKVENIFFNTPARLKYLKSEATELGNITDVVNRLAISHPEISFKLVSNGRELLKTAGNGNVQQVFSNIYGLEIAKKAIPFTGTSLDFQIEGLIGLPEVTRASRNYMTILVNGRYVKNFLISKAVLDAYHTLLPINRYPYALLSITLDPYLVDVNVHPSKMEVRMSKESELMELVTRTIKLKLQSLALIPTGFSTVKIEKPINDQQSLRFETSSKPSQTMVQYFNQLSTNENEMKFNQDQKSQFEHFVVAENRGESLTKAFDEVYIDNGINQNYNDSKVETVTKGIISTKLKNSTDASDTDTHSFFDGENEMDNQLTESKIPPLYLIGQLHGTYLLAQNEYGLYIIDQHAAQERMKYEFYKVKFAEVRGELQDLLIPITLNYASDDFIKIHEKIKILEEVGVYLEEFGGNSYIVRAIPTWFPASEEHAILEELVEQVLSSKKADIGKIREEAAIMMSCKGSIKANRHLRQDEMQSLLDDLRKTNNPFTCPHGRPIIVQFTQYEIEKMFKRVM